MFTILLFILLPFAFLIHDMEEIVMRKRCMPTIAKITTEKFPRMRPIVLHLQNMSTAKFIIIVIEEFFLIVVAVTIFYYTRNYNPIFALFWGFGIHLAIHIIQAIAIRRYIPGLVTTILLIPYCSIGIRDMILRFEYKTNLSWAICDFLVIAINLFIMHKISRK